MRALAAPLAGLLLALLLVACGVPGVPEETWVPAEDIDGRLAVEIDSTDSVPADAGGALRVVTFNVHFGADVEGIAAALAASPGTAGADVLLLQEIESYPDEGTTRAARLAALLAMNHVYAPAREEGDGTHGLAILSRFPLERVEVMRLPHIDLTYRDRDRIALAADVVTGGAPLRVVDVHLDTRTNLTDRVGQLHPAVAASDDRVLFGGDFNTDPYVWIASGLPLASLAALGIEQAAGLDDYMRAMEFETPTSGAGDTFHAGPLGFRLDSIYIRDLDPGDSGVAADVTVSDHVPLWLDLDCQ